MNTSYAFARRGPDRVTEELAGVLLQSAAIEFKSLFTIVHANLKARKAASGGEEMLRLRSYEKLQSMVQAGLVKKLGKEYSGVRSVLTSFLADAAALTSATVAPAQSRQREPLAKPVSSKNRRVAPSAIAAA